MIDATKRGLIDHSFVFVANLTSLDEILDMPLAVVHVDKENWKKSAARL